MNLEEGLEKRKAEITDLDNEIKQLDNDAKAMKETVQKYNELKQRESELKKLKRQKERDLNVVLGFFKDTDEHFLYKIFPMFHGHQEDNKREPVDA